MNPFLIGYRIISWQRKTKLPTHTHNRVDCQLGTLFKTTSNVSFFLGLASQCHFFRFFLVDGLGGQNTQLNSKKKDLTGFFFPGEFVVFERRARKINIFIECVVLWNLLVSQQIRVTQKTNKKKNIIGLEGILIQTFPLRLFARLAISDCSKAPVSLGCRKYLPSTCKMKQNDIVEFLQEV